MLWPLSGMEEAAKLVEQSLVGLSLHVYIDGYMFLLPHSQECTSFTQPTSHLFDLIAVMRTSNVGLCFNLTAAAQHLAASGNNLNPHG